MNSEAIALVQKRLGLLTTGVFDEQTAAAVKKFQLDSKLRLDPAYERFGEVGAVTWKALFDGQVSRPDGGFTRPSSETDSRQG
jgi:peptidoglycan hydrolase-like protein with peptidoglycan-binding domain